MLPACSGQYGQIGTAKQKMQITTETQRARRRNEQSPESPFIKGTKELVRVDFCEKHVPASFSPL
jgi:hypothetical protein